MHDACSLLLLHARAHTHTQTHTHTQEAVNLTYSVRDLGLGGCTQPLNLFLMQVKLEKLSSHKYVVEKGNSMSTALLDTIGYSFSNGIQNVSNVISSNYILNVRSSFIFASCSCACIGRSAALSKAHEFQGSRTQSKPAKVSAGKYLLNLSSRVCRC